MLNTAWYLYYGRRFNMSRAEVLSCPVGELRDMIACLQISNGAEPVVYGSMDELAAIP